MMADRFTKRQRACLRKLASEAHCYELGEALAHLYAEFGKWGGDGMSAFDLNDKIHEFHDGISRDLYKTYVLSNPEMAVAIGIFRKAIDPDRLDAELRGKIAPIVESFERMKEPDENDAT
jgi:hypothetical protein